jgi:hypothetical protein
MYIKMSFNEAVVIIPQCWSGILVTMDKGTAPEILDQLPENIKANQPSNIKYLESGKSITLEEWAREDDGRNYKEKKYDYYYDCGVMTRDEIMNGIDQFMQRNESNMKTSVADEGYPMINPAFEILKNIFNNMLRNEKMVDGYAAAGLFAIKLNDDFRDGAAAPSPKM